MKPNMKPNMKQLTTLLYGIFAAGAVMQFSFTTIIVGSLALLAAIIILYRKRKEVAGTLFESHFTWLIRTFWIGGGVILPVLTGVESVILFQKIDINAIVDKMIAGQISDPMQMQEMLVGQYGTFFTILTLAFTAPFAAWWLWRCWKGYAALKADHPVERVMRWV